MFTMQSVSLNPLKATFWLSSAASLTLGWSQNGVLGNGLSLYHTIPTLKKKALENTVGKGENAENQQFLLFQQCFLLNQRQKSSF